MQKAEIFGTFFNEKILNSQKSKLIEIEILLKQQSVFYGISKGAKCPKLKAQIINKKQ